VNRERSGRDVSISRVAVLVSALVVVLVSASLASAAGPAPNIEIKQHKFSPATLTIPVGATVTWVNHDDDVHTVVSSAQAFVSQAIETDESFAHTFSKPGTYTYFCTLHPLMTATIIVK
jgi:plastocyanin